MVSKFSRVAVQRSGKQLALLALDVGATITALLVAAIVSGSNLPVSSSPSFFYILLASAALAAAIFYFAGLTRRFWRFVSIIDLGVIIVAAAVNAIALMGLLNAFGRPASPSFAAEFWALTVLIMGSMRLARRAAPIIKLTLERMKSAPAPAAIVAGDPENLDLVLRQLTEQSKPAFNPVGGLHEQEFDYKRMLRGVPMLGAFDRINRVYAEMAAKNRAPELLVIAASDDAIADPRYVALASKARALGLRVSRARLGSAFTDETVTLRDFDSSELLGRAPAKLDTALISRAIQGKRILVTGAGGSIGGELVRQIASLDPAEITLLESSEFNLYRIDLELSENYPNTNVSSVLCDICDRDAVLAAFADAQPDIVYHAAALKHVPLVEKNPCAGVATNVLGTRNVADAARLFRAKAMVQVSTDKAVNPVGMMGATKRLGELYAQALDLESEGDQNATRFMTVRFGNVLNSSGSVVPLFRRQLREGSPLTITDKEMKRFFMTVHEAVSLILQSSQSALEIDSKRGRIFVLDMGEPIKIVDIADRMIRLSGLTRDLDAQIKIIGKRPGEKLFEELFDETEERLESAIPGIFEAEPAPVALQSLNETIEALSSAILRRDEAAVRQCVFEAIGVTPQEEKAPAAAEMGELAPRPEPAPTGAAASATAPAGPAFARQRAAFVFNRALQWGAGQ